ncbi:MAG: thiosulfate oxidation carrier complex protein SoxZ, partial [Gammaproteobacteria bacterium]|nr:thiosulfate oxidation carrier complex protein SoxZ [Gammaproteobacteria bacterium]
MAKSIKLRAKSKKGVVTVKCLMNHPMETGLRKDKKTG